MKKDREDSGGAGDTVGKERLGAGGMLIGVKEEKDMPKIDI